MNQFGLSPIDLGIIIFYLVGIIWYGIRSGKKGSSDEYFLGGRDMTWFTIGLSMFAANISSNSLVAITGGATKGGIAFYNYEWMATVVLAFFCVFILPFYLKTGIYTMPEFLEKRFDSRSRYYFSFITLVGNIFIDTAGTLFAGALIVKLVYPEVPTVLVIAALALFAASYTVLGGLSSVMKTEVLNTIILLISAVIVATITYIKAGGYGEIVKTANAKSPTFMHLILPSNHPDMPWQGLVFGVPLLGFYFWCNNQFIVQRALSAKSVDEARKGALFAGVLKIPILFLLVLPGIATLKLFPEMTNSDQAFPTLVFNLLPHGLIGLVVAGFLAAMASAISATLNSASTLVTMDFVKKVRPDMGEKALVRAGQIATLVFVLIAVLWSPQIARFDSLMNYMQSILGLISPPVVAVFLLGLFWRRTNGTGAFTGLMVGFALAVWTVISPGTSFLGSFHFLVAPPILLIICGLVTMVFSVLTPKPDYEKIKGMIYTQKIYDADTASLKGLPWHQNYRVLALISLIITAIVVWIYR
ncbi:sodium:solute symporter [Emticicia sp. C21]|uniref:sodium:solute symporter n=1 Tax=Emticicia sp. C21 TaxID=2302915 RepID=UPI000E352A72|nr:sodium:solute symporter [Emticicia sp. C21]RFS13480.1 sodium transporter [Emticicia sp. C21]